LFRLSFSNRLDSCAVALLDFDLDSEAQSASVARGANWTIQAQVKVNRAKLNEARARLVVEGLQVALKNAVDVEAVTGQLKIAISELNVAVLTTALAESEACAEGATFVQPNQLAAVTANSEGITSTTSSRKGAFSIAASNCRCRSKVHGVDVLLETVTVAVALLCATSLLAFCLMSWSGSGADDV